MGAAAFGGMMKKYRGDESVVRCSRSAEDRADGDVSRGCGGGSGGLKKSRKEAESGAATGSSGGLLYTVIALCPKP